MKSDNHKIAVIGLGYVGLPILSKFSEKYDSVGFDTSLDRIDELRSGFDKTLEIEDKDILKKLKVTNEEQCLHDRNIFIITVPTPVNKKNEPDLRPLELASRTVAKYLESDSIVIYESTVYPGVTEDFCAKILEEDSGLKFNKDFFCGYSPERINPSDKEHTLERIIKVTSGSTPESAKKIDDLYASIIPAGTHPVKNIKVAEAAKVIENAQRDINIAFMNELSLIFKKLNINTFDVLEAANTKWNFLDFKPGLVGGHCIGVDPYYLSYIAKKEGYDSKIITAGRQLNDEMFLHISKEILNHISSKKDISKANVLILGVTFKANCPDIRNSKVFDLINHLNNSVNSVDCVDPHASYSEVLDIHNIKLKKIPDLSIASYDAIIYAVPHFEFYEINIEEVPNQIIYDFYGIGQNSHLSL